MAKIMTEVEGLMKVRKLGLDQVQSLSYLSTFR